MNIIRARVFLVVAISVMIFTSIISVLDSVNRAPSSFAANEGYVISTPGAPTVFSSSVDVGLAEFLANSSLGPGSPEVFAFTSYDGIPFVIRGVELELVSKIGPQLTTTRYDGGTGLHGRDALVGKDLLKRLGLLPPCDLPVTASYRSRLLVLHVVGWTESSSALDDEVLVSLETARYLSGMSQNKVSIVRLASMSSDLKGALMPTGPRFAIYDFESSKSVVIPDQEFKVSVTVKNWGTRSGAVNVSFADSTTLPGETIFNTTVSLNAGVSVQIEHLVTYSEIGDRNIQARIDGDDPQSLEIGIQVVSPFLIVNSPAAVGRNLTFEVTVTDSTYAPLAGARIDFLNETVFTNASGIARLVAYELGNHSINASCSGFSGASSTVNVYDTSASPNEFKPQVSDFVVVPNSFKETESAQVRLIVENRGLQAGVFAGTILLDGSTVIAEVNMTLGPGATGVASYTLGGIRSGHHELTLGSIEYSFDVYPWYASEPDLLLLAIKYGGTLKVSSADTIPIVEAAKISQGDIEVALVSVGAISGMMAALSMTSIFSKEVHEARNKLGILRTIGASSPAIRKLVLRESLIYSVPAAAVGIGLSLLVTAALLSTKQLMVFGHSLRFGVDASVAPWILIGAILICLVSALASAEVAVRATPVSSIRKIEDSGLPPMSVDEVLGDE